MADEREPRIELLRPTPTERAVAPVRAPAPVRARAEVTELYRRTDEQAPPRPTDANRLLVAQVMRRPVYTLAQTARAGEAMALLDAHRIHHLPLVDADERLVGLLTQSDLFEALRTGRHAIDEVPVARLMTREVIALRPDHTLHEAARLLIAGHHRGGPVVDPARRVVGFLSARDVLSVLVTRAPLTLWV